MNNKLVTILILISIFAILTIVYPKKMVIGGLGGFITNMSQTAYKEEYSCFGFSQKYCPTNCADCGCDILCYGITYNKECYIEGTSNKTVTACR